MPKYPIHFTQDQPAGIVASITTEWGHLAYVSHDDDCPQPFEGDDAVRIVVLHRRYIDPSNGACGSTPDEVAAWEAENADEWWTIPLFMYDHSGTAYRTGHSNPFHCPWDSGRVGIIALKRSEFDNSAFGGPDLETQAASIADTYTKWANGETYSCAIYDRDGELQDSCGGFIGMDAAREYADEMFDLIFTKPGEYEVQHQTLVEGWINNWTVIDPDGAEKPETFETIEAAQTALNEFFAEIEAEKEAGQRDLDSGYDRCEFRIMKVGAE